MSYRERFKEEAVLDSSVFPLGELLISTARKEYTTTHSWFSQGWNYQMTLWKGVGLPCVGWMCMSRDEYHPSPDNVSGFFFTRRTTASGASSGRFQEWKPWSWKLRNGQVKQVAKFGLGSHSFGPQLACRVVIEVPISCCCYYSYYQYYAWSSQAWHLQYKGP